MARQIRTHVLVLAASKGGVGKTTIASALAVRAAADGKRVALVDTDPQASLERWWELRGEPDNPRIVGVDASAEGLGHLISEGFEWVIIDTPPALMDHIHEAVSVSDFVIVPTRASAIDVEAVSAVRDICVDLEKPFAFLLNAVEPGKKLTRTAAEYLQEDGPLLDTQIPYRFDYVRAMTTGKSAPEIERGTLAEKDIDALWAEIKKLTTRAINKRARANV